MEEKNTENVVETTEENMENLGQALEQSYAYMGNGEYDTDFISCVLWQGVAENTSEYCKKGDLVGVKGRIQSRMIERENEEYARRIVEIVAEKVTFLSGKK